MSEHYLEVAKGERFKFGENWSRFISLLNDQRIAIAEQSLKEFLEVDNLYGKSFIDIGSGSGLFSLSARRLGARVHSFDYDPQSVACTQELKQRFYPDDASWSVEQGSVLDKDLMNSLGTFDVVYSWGVLHHTGQMWQALENVAPLVNPGGQLFIAIYNDQGRASSVWKKIKQVYCKFPDSLKFIVLWPTFARLWGPTILRDLVAGRPLHSWRNYSSVRGMSPWRDVVDWVGGYPFEVAKPEEIFNFYKARGFSLQNLRTCAGGIGCNEFVFRKNS